MAAGTGMASASAPVKTTVTITSTSATLFTGKVGSPKKACAKGRKITLYRQMTAREGYAGYPGYEPVGTDTTDASGNWEVTASNAFLEGDYRVAVAAKKVSTGNGFFLSCAARWGIPTPA
jgi:hypothetical protein